MIQFHETMMGRRFFEGQLPKLLEVLERIAVSLEKNTVQNGDERNERLMLASLVTAMEEIGFQPLGYKMISESLGLDVKSIELLIERARQISKEKK